MIKICKACGTKYNVELEMEQAYQILIEYFQPSPNQPDGLRGVCRKCATQNNNTCIEEI